MIRQWLLRWSDNQLAWLITYLQQVPRLLYVPGVAGVIYLRAGYESLAITLFFLGFLISISPIIFKRAVTHEQIRRGWKIEDPKAKQ